MRWWHHAMAIGVIGLLLPVYIPDPVSAAAGVIFGQGAIRWAYDRYVGGSPLNAWRTR